MLITVAGRSKGCWALMRSNKASVTVYSIRKQLSYLCTYNNNWMVVALSVES